MTTTSTKALGIQIRVRFPDFAFDERLPRRHAGASATTEWVNMVSVFTTVAERMFIRSSTLLQQLVEQPEHHEELAAFIQQEAIHSSMHERLNKVLRAWGYPVEAFQDYVQGLLDAAVDAGGHRMMVAMALAGEQANGVFSDAVLDHPERLAAWDERVRKLFQWHAYEEVEHTAALFDAFRTAIEDDETAYRLRMWGVAYIATLTLASWGVGTYAFLEHGAPGQGAQLDRWREIGAFLLGEGGLLRGNDEGMRAYLRRDFHPWQGRDAHQRLEQHREHVRPEWVASERRKAPAARSAHTLDAATLRRPVKAAREALNFARFAAHVTIRTARFLRERRPADDRAQTSA